MIAECGIIRCSSYLRNLNIASNFVTNVGQICYLQISFPEMTGISYIISFITNSTFGFVFFAISTYV